MWGYEYGIGAGHAKYMRLRFPFVAGLARNHLRAISKSAAAYALHLKRPKGAARLAFYAQGVCDGWLRPLDRESAIYRDL
jgi:hypothetical protein